MYIYGVCRYVHGVLLKLLDTFTAGFGVAIFWDKEINPTFV